jgi:hypothetical protein
MKGRNYLGDSGTDMRILKYMDLKEQCENVDWIHLIEDRVHYQAFVNMVMNPWFHKKWQFS